MKSLYESAFGYITKQIDKRINALQDECDAQVASLEAQKKAAAEFYQVQIDNIEEQVNAKEKEIESIQKAAEARKREIDLQKAQYELARKENQRTVSVYKDGQMVHDVDTEGIRDAREDVANIRREKEIVKIEDEVDVLNEQKEALEKALEASNKYWDEQIENVERNFDALIKGMEDYKSRWEELGEIAENAKMNAALKELGITEQDIANMSEEAFQKVKNSYLGILSDMYGGNDLMMQQLSELSGVDMSGLTGYLESTKGAFGDLDSVSLENLSSQIDSIATTSSSLADSSSDASASIENISSNAAGATESIQPLNTEIEKLKQMLSEVMELFKTFEFPEIGDENYAQKLTAIADGFHKISEKCKELEQVDFSSIMGSTGGTLPESGAEESTDSGFRGLASAISEAVTVITTQMTNLQTALQTGNDAFADQIAFIADEYIPAWENLQSRLAEIIGVGGGTGGKEGGKKSSDGKKSKDGSDKSESSGGAGSIIDTMQTGGEEVAARLEDPWLHSFNEFATGENSVQSIAELIKEIVTEMAESIRAQCESAAKALDALAEKAFSVSGSGGFSGHAYASGTGGALPNKVRNALVGDDPDHKPELVCDPETGQYSVFTSPTITDLNKGSTVYNGKETEEIFRNSGNRNSGKFTLTGQSFANGTGGISSNIVPISPDDAIFAMQKKWMEMMSDGTQMFVPPTNAMNLATGAMNDVTTAIKNNNVSKVVNIDFGEIHLHEVQNADGFANEILMRTRGLINQEMHKF